MSNNLNNSLDKVCLICNEPNRRHVVFASPYHPNGYTKQWTYVDDMGKPLVEGHYSCLDNLKYIEYLYEQSIK